MATDRVYRWKEGTPFNADPNKVHDELEKIRIKNKSESIESLSPRDVLELARNSKTELHKCFEWDDSKAAEKHRLGIAGLVLRALVYDHYVIENAQKTQKNLGGVVVAPLNNTPKKVALPVRAYERMGPRKFGPTELVLKDPEIRDILLSEISRAISILRNKIHSYNLIASDTLLLEVDKHLENASEVIDNRKK